jgi:uncharacterized protein (UPF0276 family)
MSLIKRNLGVGVGLRPAHYEQFLRSLPKSISWVEVISENFMSWPEFETTRSQQTLLKIRKDLPVVLHGVSMSLGSVDPLNIAYLQNLKDLILKVQPAWVSDHICWTGFGGRNSHDLLPLPYTEESLNLICEKIIQTQDFLGQQILIENASTYLEFNTSQMPEWEFVSSILEKADCGLLLDINNVYVSSVNHKFDPLTYLMKIPKDRVGQIHLAGHTKLDGHLVDTHDEPICPEVWELYRWASQYFGQISTMIERDANIPEWTELETEILQVKEIFNHATS